MTHVRDPAEFSRLWHSRMRELKLEADLKIAGQHVTSKVILKRFADDSGKVAYLDLRFPGAKVGKIGPGGAGKKKDFVPIASKSAEALWAKTEDRLPRALELCDQGNAHTDSLAMETLRDAVALHYVRSLQTPEVHARAYREARDRLRRIARASVDLEAVFFSRYGFYPAGEGAFDAIFDEALAGYDEDFTTGLIFRASLERLFEGVKAWLSQYRLEVVHPESGEFLIGDCPALTVGYDGRLGHGGGGIALGDASQIVMPIGPHSLLAVGPEHRRGVVPVRAVNLLNSWQVLGANQHVLFRPEL